MWRHWWMTPFDVKRIRQLTFFNKRNINCHFNCLILFYAYDMPQIWYSWSKIIEWSIRLLWIIIKNKLQPLFWHKPFFQLSGTNCINDSDSNNLYFSFFFRFTGLDPSWAASPPPSSTRWSSRHPRSTRPTTTPPLLSATSRWRWLDYFLINFSFQMEQIEKNCFYV